MLTHPLMPKATAIWLLEHTSLTFEQIAEFCGLHLLEVKAMADGEVSESFKGLNPINSGQLTRVEIERCENDHTAKLKLSVFVIELQKNSKKRNYVPLAMRQEKPNAIAWLIKNCPEMTDKDIAQVVKSTKKTVQAIRSKTYWDYQNIRLKDPVLLGLCSQYELDEVYAKAKDTAEKIQRQLDATEKTQYD